MTIEILRQDMVAAMKAKDKETKDAISSLIAAVKKVAIDEGVREDIPESLVFFTKTRRSHEISCDRLGIYAILVVTHNACSLERLF